MNPFKKQVVFTESNSWRGEHEEGGNYNKSGSAGARGGHHFPAVRKKPIHLGEKRSSYCVLFPYVILLLLNTTSDMIRFKWHH